MQGGLGSRCWSTAVKLSDKPNRDKSPSEPLNGEDGGFVVRYQGRYTVLHSFPVQTIVVEHWMTTHFFGSGHNIDRAYRQKVS